jgi:hypothetical protein
MHALLPLHTLLPTLLLQPLLLQQQLLLVPVAAVVPSLSPPPLPLLHPAAAAFAAAVTAIVALARHDGLHPSPMLLPPTPHALLLLLPFSPQLCFRRMRVLVLVLVCVLLCRFCACCACCACCCDTSGCSCCRPSSCSLARMLSAPVLLLLTVFTAEAVTHLRCYCYRYRCS